MAGVKGRSGPPGNLNAAKSGIDCWLKHRALPRDKQHIGRLICEYRERLIVCRGGFETITEVEIALVENAARAYAACLLLLEEGARRGLVYQDQDKDGAWDLAPGFGRLQGFLNIEQRALSLLGVNRNSKEAGKVIEQVLD